MSWACCVFRKKLTNEGLHIFASMVGYCLRDDGEDHFEFMHYNVTNEETNDIKLEH